MKKNVLTMIFLDLYRKSFINIYIKRININIGDFVVLEKTLEDYILKIMGVSIFHEYRLYRDGIVDDFDYFREVRVALENIFNNIPNKEMINLIDWINDYAVQFNDNLTNHHYTELLINGIKKAYSDNPNDIAISNKDKTYCISIKNIRSHSPIPSSNIKNIDQMESILKNYINTITSSDSYYNLIFSSSSGYTFDEAIEYTFLWTLRNATSNDLNNLEEFFKKYESFLKEDTLNIYKHKPSYLGQIMGDELYVFYKRATVTYETPYYLSFMLKNKHIELPNIRMGIDTIGEKKKAHILATQSSQEVSNTELDDIFKRLLPKSKNFREFNPSHLISIVLTMGLLNGCGIKDVEITEYLPLRYQKFIIDNGKSEDEMDDIQHRLTNKFVNNFFRMMEFSEGIEVSNYPENNQPLQLRLADDIIWENAFLTKIYEIGYKAGLNTEKKSILK